MKSSNKRQQKSGKTKGIIIDASKKLFFAHGFSDVSTEQIAKEAGISKGGIFHHFSTKEELGLATLRSTLDDFQHLLPIIEESQDLRAVMKMVVSETMSFGRENPGFIKMLLWFLLRIDEKSDNKQFYLLMKETFLESLLPYAQILETLFTRLGQTQPREKALLLMGLLDGIVIYATYVDKLSKFEPELADYFDDFDNLADIVMELFFPKKE